MPGALLRRLSLALLPFGTVIALIQPISGDAGARQGASVSANSLVDLDHNLAFPQNKQNEPAITRDPLTGVLIVGANDEIGQPLCPGTSVPLSSPCSFKPGVPTSAYYRSVDGGKTWSGGYLPGFDSIGKTSGAIPAWTTDPGSVPRVGLSATRAGRSSTTPAWRIHFQRRAASWVRFPARRTAL